MLYFKIGTVSSVTANVTADVSFINFFGSSTFKSIFCVHMYVSISEHINFYFDPTAEKSRAINPFWYLHSVCQISSLTRNY